MKNALILSIVLPCLVFVFACGSNKEPSQTADGPLSSDQVASLDIANSFATDEGMSVQFEQADLRILYAGHPGSERERDFVQFLIPHFKSVKTADLKGFKEKQAADCDVLILDYDGDGFEAPSLHLSRKYTRATVTVGVVGAFICDNMSLKTGYL